METKYFSRAHNLNEEYKQLLVKNSVHFRASLNSLSLISVSAEKPELGVKCSYSKDISKSDVQNLIIADIKKLMQSQFRIV